MYDEVEEILEALRIAKVATRKLMDKTWESRHVVDKEKALESKKKYEFIITCPMCSDKIRHVCSSSSSLVRKI